MKYSNRRKYRDQSVEIIEEAVVKKTTKKLKKKKESLLKKIGKNFLSLFKKNK